MNLNVLPIELKIYISMFIFTKCDICSRRIEFWNQHELKNIYNVKLINNSYKFLSIFEFKKKTCIHCYCMIKYWFR